MPHHAREAAKVTHATVKQFDLEHDYSKDKKKQQSQMQKLVQCEWV